jgi:hypothetical protein
MLTISGTPTIAERPPTGNHQELKGRQQYNDHNSRNAYNSRHESNNRTADTIYTPAKPEMLAKVVKPPASRPTTAGTLLKSEMTAAAGTIGTSWMLSAEDHFAAWL